MCTERFNQKYGLRWAGSLVHVKLQRRPFKLFMHGCGCVCVYVCVCLSMLKTCECAPILESALWCYNLCLPILIKLCERAMFVAERSAKRLRTLYMWWITYWFCVHFEKWHVYKNWNPSSGPWSNVSKNCLTHFFLALSKVHCTCVSFCFIFHKNWTTRGAKF